MPYLNCPTCGLTLSEAAIRSPFQACPRCALRRGVHMQMQLIRSPARFTRPRQLDQVAQAKERLQAGASDR